MVIFCAFDSINYIEDLKFEAYAASSACGFVEFSPLLHGGKYRISTRTSTLSSITSILLEISDLGVHFLAVKDTLGVLTPCDIVILVLVLKEELPDMPLHI